MNAAIEVTDNDIEADAAKPHRRLRLARRFRDDHDRTPAIENCAGPGRKVAAKPDVDAVPHVRLSKLRGLARIEHLHAGVLERQHRLRCQRLQLTFQGLIERWMLS